MAALMKKLVESGADLSCDDRNLLSVAYKNVIGSRRTGWRVITSLEQKAADSEQKVRVAKEFREKIEKESRCVCNEVLGLIDKYLLPKSDQPESQVFYLKMKGDYNRYLAEIEKGSERNGKLCVSIDYLSVFSAVVEKSEQAYNDALDVAKKSLQPTHPIRLGLALNFSVFYYEIADSHEKACQLAKEVGRILK